jgi:hypothetical protein
MIGNSRPKHVEIDRYIKNKYTKNKLGTKLALFKKLLRIATLFYPVLQNI